MIEELKTIHARNYGVYGVRKMRHAARRARWNTGRDQVTRLMKIAGMSGVRHGQMPVTTRPTPVPDSRPDLVGRQFKASRPNQLWVTDITYVPTLSGFVSTAFVTDIFSRKIMGWATRSSMTTEALPLEALEQAIIGGRKRVLMVWFITPITPDNTRQLPTAISSLTYAIKSSTGSVGHSYDNALTETVNGRYNSELIYSQSRHSCTEVK